ncbi:FtsQ-type POTRA domain-containing protein [Candidatus Gracilibacteria bacterium]|nr:FtsQ-type POTRA domain-containing protein [Candidatus Gracilibacteria bacterium]
MYLSKIKKFLNKYKKSKRPTQKKSRLILSKIEQTTFIKKRKQIKFNYSYLNKINHFLNKYSNKGYYLYIILFIIISLVLYISYGPTFKIKYIEIIKQDNITNMNIAYKATDKYRGTNIFSIEKKDILKRLKDYQQNIKNINTSIKLPNTLKININSYKTIFNTTINGKTYLITENGTLIPSTYSKDLKELKIIYNFDKNKFLDYKKVLNSDFLKKITFIVNQTKENIIDINIKELKYYIIERELHIKTDKNTILIYNLSSQIKEQIKKLSIFNKEKININKSNIIYIDLRIKNKVFYCTNEKEYQCIQNLKSIYPNG